MDAETCALKSRYHTSDLSCRSSVDGVEIRFAACDLHIAESCLRIMEEARDHVEALLEHAPSSKLFIFMYPDLASMNLAFRRELPHDDCCFVPIKGPESVICFVARRTKLSSVKAILAHEYCHIVFDSLTGNRETGPWRQRIPVWLDEGIAMYVDSAFRDNLAEIESRRLALVRQGADGWWPDLNNQYTYFNRLDGTTEFGPRGMLAYTYSYFCVKELIYRFGIKKIRRFAASLASGNNISSKFHTTCGISVRQYNCEIKRLLVHREDRKPLPRPIAHAGRFEMPKFPTLAQ